MSPVGWKVSLRDDGALKRLPEKQNLTFKRNKTFFYFLADEKKWQPEIEKPKKSKFVFWGQKRIESFSAFCFGFFLEKNN